MTIKKRKVNISLILIPILSISLIFTILLIFTNASFWFKSSIHEDAKRYATKHCLVFYPDSAIGKRVAKQIAKENKNDRIFDYSLVPYGDYYLVDYGNDVSYFVDKNYDELTINTVDDDGKRIIADYLRYWVKREQNDLYYTKDFMEKSYVDNLSFEEATYSIDGENLKCRLKDFDIDILVPLKYIQESINMNFGYTNETYIKPVYIDDSHPVICLTFDDGPNFWTEKEVSSSTSIVDTLYKYDANGTFYVVGDCLEEDDTWTDYEIYSFLKQSITNGNEYGSHTQSHYPTLDELDGDEIVDAINGPADYLKENLDYDMKTYRPPEGVINDDILAVEPYAAIFWSIDSKDWSLRDSEKICERILNCDIDDGDILLFHEIYDETAKAIEKIVPELLEKGYQMVSVTDMLTSKNINVSSIKYYYNLNPYPYYE